MFLLRFHGPYPKKQNNMFLRQLPTPLKWSDHLFDMSSYKNIEILFWNTCKGHLKHISKLSKPNKNRATFKKKKKTLDFFLTLDKQKKTFQRKKRRKTKIHRGTAPGPPPWAPAGPAPAAALARTRGWSPWRRRPGGERGFWVIFLLGNLMFFCFFFCFLMFEGCFLVFFCRGGRRFCMFL